MDGPHCNSRTRVRGLIQPLAFGDKYGKRTVGLEKRGRGRTVGIWYEQPRRWWWRRRSGGGLSRGRPARVEGGLQQKNRKLALERASFLIMYLFRKSFTRKYLRRKVKREEVASSSGAETGNSRGQGRWRELTILTHFNCLVNIWWYVFLPLCEGGWKRALQRSEERCQRRCRNRARYVCACQPRRENIKPPTAKWHRLARKSCRYVKARKGFMCVFQLYGMDSGASSANSSYSSTTSKKVKKIAPPPGMRSSNFWGFHESEKEWAQKIPE